MIWLLCWPIISSLLILLLLLLRWRLITAWHIPEIGQP